MGGETSTSSSSAAAGGERGITIDLEAARDLNLAMVANAVPLVRRLSLSNTGSEAREGLTVEVTLAPDYSATWSAHVSTIPPGGTFTFDVVELPLEQARLVNQVERTDGVLTVTVRANDVLVATRSLAVGVLAYNEWSASTVPQLLAAFVIPNHPAVARILSDARAAVQRITGDPALDGYQSRSPGRVQGMAQGIYETIQALGITYSNPPASFEASGQKIRTPEQVLEHRMGTCLDLSVLLAACFEQVGLHPMLLVLDGHALPAVWLVEHELAEGATDDGLRLRKHAELDRLLVFDSSAVATRPIVPFAQAVRRGLEYLDTPDFRFAVDVRASRRQRFLPLPARVVGEYATVEAAPALVVVGPTSGPAPANSGEASGPAKAAKVPRVEKWKQRLLDTSLRNRLLNFRQDGKQVLRVLGKDLPRLEDALARGASLQLLPRPDVFGDKDPRARKLVDERLGDDALEAFLREHRDAGALHVDVAADALWGRATEIFRTARESIEESGTNTLCLALGMLRWYESAASEEPRLAPILLLPVTLKRDARSSQFSLSASGEETRLNATMLEKLRSEHGISLPELAELPEDEAGVDVAAVLNVVRGAVVNLHRWEVATEAYLAHFSFAKFLMWADLEQRAAALLDSPVVAHLVNGKGGSFPNTGAFVEAQDLDRRYGPEDLLCPLDADASQLAAVAAAGEGRSFVLQGPPGTGKSQSITNLIAHCLAQGKRVLFVAEKVAALDVVHRRLSRVGLAPFCLELHSNKSSKQHVLGQLQAALDVEPVARPADWDTSLAALRRERDQLNAYADALHRDRAGLTVFKALSRLTALRTAPRVPLDDACSRSRPEIESTVAAAESLEHAVEALPPLPSVAWQGCELPTWDLGLMNRVRDAIDRLEDQLAAVASGGADVGTRLAVVPPSTLTGAAALGVGCVLMSDAPPKGDELLATEQWPEVHETAITLVRAGHAHDVATTALAERYADGLFALDLPALKRRFDRYAGSFFLVAWWMLRSARKVLAKVVRGPRVPRARDVADDLGLALAARDHAKTIATLGARGRPIFGPLWDPPRTDWAAMERAVEWAAGVQAAMAQVQRSGALVSVARAGAADPMVRRRGVELQAHVQAARASLAELSALLGWHPEPSELEPGDAVSALRAQVVAWRGQLHLLREWFAYQEAGRGLRNSGAHGLVDAVAAGRVAPPGIAAAAERSALEAWLIRTSHDDAALRSFHGDPQRALVDAFAMRDRALLRDTQTVTRAQLAARAPRTSVDASGASELGILQRELKKKAKHKPLRKLFREIPEIVTRLKPCFLMSPLSVAQYLEPDAVKFDVVVFDEASQIPTHDAIGALARGRSAVIVGDSKQLPPTTFFQQAGDGADDEDEFEELESILDECSAAGLPSRRLDWHYRSRHEDLIAFSNHRYYDNRLNTFPASATRGPHLGVSMRMVAGVYDKGGARTNRAEAEALVQELVARLLDPEQAKRSIGIVTFSQAQQKLVEDLIDQQRRRHDALARFFDDKLAEPVIVKNLENIQGDERDVMLFSICYGPDGHGRVAMNFGPLNREGGERRLNVAVTRAREELVVFSTLRPEQIDLSRTDARGVRDLKAFLDYAERGPKAIAEALEVGAEARFDSPFEEEVHRRLIAGGWSVDTQVGCAGYRIDLGVRQPDLPGRYVLGVECDGAYYHSARSARERDRLRAEVLGTLGWKLHRIWSTDWWLDPDREMKKLEQAIRAAVQAPSPSPVRADTPTYAVPPTVPTRATEPGPSALAANGGLSPPTTAVAPAEPGEAQPYRVADPPAGRRGADDFYSPGHSAELRALVDAVVSVEAPVSLGLLAKRISSFYGIPRTSARVTARVHAVVGDQIQQVGEFLWRHDQAPDAYRAFRVADEATRRDPADIAVEEVANAAAVSLRRNVALPFAELVKQTARALGFGRTGGRVAERMGEGIELLITRGVARRDGDKVRDGGP